jgi:Zn finger protein HypA/HybF involved in hydrogenase expression
VTAATFTCPCCGATTPHPDDIKEGYCPQCHAFTGYKAPDRGIHMDRPCEHRMDVITTTVRADAEAARAEIRAADIVCPSCGVNMADLPRDHMFTISSGRSHEDGPAVVLAREPQVAKCANGEAVVLADTSGEIAVDYETFVATANINLWDTYNRAIDTEWSKILGS